MLDDLCRDIVDSTRAEQNARLEKILRLWESEILAEFRMLYPDLGVTKIHIEIEEQMNYMVRLLYRVWIGEKMTTFRMRDEHSDSAWEDVASILSESVDALPVRRLVFTVSSYYTARSCVRTEPPIKAERKWLT